MTHRCREVQWHHGMCGQEEVCEAGHNCMVFNVMAIPGDQAAQTEVVIAGGPAVCVRACVRVCVCVCVCTGKEGGGMYSSQLRREEVQVS